MSKEYKTMRVPQDAYEQAKHAKQDGETWGEYLRRCSENPPETREFVEADPGALKPDLDVGPVTLEATEYSKIARAVEDKLR